MEYVLRLFLFIPLLIIVLFILDGAFSVLEWLAEMIVSAISGSD